MPKDKIDLSREEIYFLKFKNPAVIPLADLVKEIDEFLSRVKHSDKLTEEQKANFLNGYKRVLIDFSDKFISASKRLKIEFNEPLSIKDMR